MTLRLSNREARHLWLSCQGLCQTPTGKLDTLGLITSLGYLQIDSIQAVARAHHHIMWSRNQNYREHHLDQLLRVDKSVFEHFTHDASLIPTEFYPMWRRQFTRHASKNEKSAWYRRVPNAAGRKKIKQRIEDEGPLSSRAFESKSTEKRGMWERPPHKLALDYMWYAGELATSHRENFTKFYDLTERVIPQPVRDTVVDEDAQVNWLCCEAIQRLGFGSPGDIQRFWEATDLAEVKQWVEENASDLVDIEIVNADRSVLRTLAHKSIETRLADVEKPTSRLRILNPFDPLIRNRTRLQRLFGFDYRIEIFVPAAKRVFGYYVYPLLEGDRFVGRLEALVDRKGGTLSVKHLWHEPRAKWPPSRYDKLASELQRLGRFAGLESTETGQSLTRRVVS